MRLIAIIATVSIIVVYFALLNGYKLQIKEYFYKLFYPGSKPYVFWTNIGVFIIGVACMFFIWGIIYHLMK